MNAHRSTFQQQRADRSRGFTLVEIMIVVAITGVILAIAAPTWMRQREISRQRVCQENLSKIEGAKEQWALESFAPTDAVPTWENLVNLNGTSYLRKVPVCPSNGEYHINKMSTQASCTVIEPFDHNEDPSESLK